MATPEDINSNAEYIRMADQYEEVPGGSNHNNYANVDLIVAIAERTGVDAVWAGWGHASENPRLPEQLAKAGIEFLGPPARAMRDLGDKIASTLVAQSVGVPTVPWSGSHVRVDYAATCSIPEELFLQATVRDAAGALRVLEEIGYPAMIKASEGGGGKGIRQVSAPGEVEAALRQVQTEVPGSPVFVMRMVPQCHHLEVQILADQYGEAIALFGRDCTVQRRHQKIIEEGPITAAPAALLHRMEQDAVRLTKAVGYTSVGTVEYLYVDGKYYFLELNPRLQVEHPVTEQITGVNLPAAQLQVAMGIPLQRIADVRQLYGLEAYEGPALDLASARPLAPKGHVMAVRITAENPEQGFKPTSGQIRDITFRNSPNVWGYFSVGSSGGVHEYADSQIGHIFAWGITREDARKNALLALKDISIRGDIHTPLTLLVQLLERADFREQAIHTAWLDQLIQNKIQEVKPLSALVVVCGAVCRAVQITQTRLAQYLAGLEKGQIPSTDLLRTEEQVEMIYEGIKYTFQVSRQAPDSYLLRLASDPSWQAEAEVRRIPDGGLLVSLDGKKYTCYAVEEPTGMRLVLDRHTCIFTRESDPSQLRSASAGRLVRYLVPNGAHLPAGTAYAEVEVMKMLYTLTTLHSGRIRFVRPEGSTLETGDVIAQLELDDLSQVRSARPFEGTLPVFRPPHPPASRRHEQLRAVLRSLRLVLAGYPRQNLAALVEQLFALLDARDLPLLEFQEALAAIGARLPRSLHDQLEQIIHRYEQVQQEQQQQQQHQQQQQQHLQQQQQQHQQQPPSPPSPQEFPAREILELLESHLASLPTETERNAFASVHGQRLLELSRAYRGGLRGYKAFVVCSLLEEYLRSEAPFQKLRREEALLQLREKHRGQLQVVAEIALSHHRLDRKNALLALLLERIGEEADLEAYSGPLHEIADLPSKACAEVALRARQLLVRYRMPSFGQRRSAVEEALRGALHAATPEERADRLLALVEQSSALFDVLVSLFGHANPQIVALALEVYVRRAYKAYCIQDLAAPPAHGAFPYVEWRFRLEEEPSRAASPSLWRRGESVDDLVARGQQSLVERQRYGMLAVFESLPQLERAFAPLLEAYRSGLARMQLSPHLVRHVLGVALVQQQLPASAAETEIFSARLAAFAAARSDDLRACGISRLTFVMPRTHGKRELDMYSFYEKLNYAENAIYRHIEPALAFHLELKRLLAHYDIEKVPTENRNIHLFFAEQKPQPVSATRHLSSSSNGLDSGGGGGRTGGGGGRGGGGGGGSGGGSGGAEGERERRFFVRSLVRQRDLFSAGHEKTTSIVDVLLQESEKILVDTMHALDVALASNPRYQLAQNHHLFLKVMPEVVYEPEKVDALIRALGNRHGHRLWRLRVTQMEVVTRLRTRFDTYTVRFFIFNPSGYRFRVWPYFEKKVPGAPLEPVNPASPGPFAGQPALAPYLPLDALQRRRFQAQNEGTTFVYDFLDIFVTALGDLWNAHVARLPGVKRPAPEELLSARELVLSSSSSSSEKEGEGLQVVDREPGLNDIGMVAWHVWLRTPECPDGRELVLIANDITHHIGSFGPQEDLLFKRASEFARRRGLPRIYLAANSGAHIGLAREVYDVFRVAWLDEQNPQRGVAYLYLEREDFERLSRLGAVRGELQADGRGRLTDVIGLQHGLGVENLQGSGMIAGETSLAYEEIFTATLVTGRTVGIGAYLARLGQRVVQVENAPIILTGASALNKVLGRAVYTSNMEIGGPQVMHSNGVTHIAVTDDLKGVAAILSWLSYVPPRAGAAPQRLLPLHDPVERPVRFQPDQAPYDPRHMLAGCVDARSGEWLSGLFDRDSWLELLPGWGKTVVVGRARLGGLPVAVVAVETRSVEKITPADPANADSRQQVAQQAGQVWYPDSAYKTAQAIRDAGREGLPLIILANWRGFSGGMRDMFDEVLKFGSYIVDALRTYPAPVSIYLPPAAELRGGAWVVLDPQINPAQIEMYADPSARGGVLEPSGTVEIKYRQRELLRTIRRLDPVLQQLRDRKQQEEREAFLMPIYQQVALAFAELHDTPGRMLAKGVIRDIVPWHTARSFFFHRFCRRLAVQSLQRRVQEAYPRFVPPSSAPVDLRDLLAISEHGRSLLAQHESAWTSDAAVTSWIESHAAQLDTFVADLRRQHFAEQVATLLGDGSALDSFLSVISPELKRQILEKLRKELC